MSKPILGKAGSKPVEIGLPFRALVMADTGGGKSYTIRRILEQTHGKTQQIIIDPEGEYSSLREKYDYLIAAPHGGDVEATPRTAATLARLLRETRASAVIDIFDLKMEMRPRFVRLFFEALMNMPKKLNHPLMLILEEASLFCPEGDKSESAAAVKDVAARGRKRGISLIAVTQRIAVIQKGMAAQLKNRLIGSATLDTDVKRIAFELGMTSAEAMKKLSALKPGEFYAKGPQLTKLVTLALVGRVMTRHPQEGDSSYFTPPKPSKNLIKVIKSAFADLPAEAEREARTEAELKKEVGALRRELTIAKKAQRPGGVDKKEVERKIAVAVLRAQKDADARNRDHINLYEKHIKELRAREVALLKAIHQTCDILLRVRQLAPIPEPMKAPCITKDNTPVAKRGFLHSVPGPAGPQHFMCKSSVKKVTQADSHDDLSAKELAILKALAARHPLGYSRIQLALVTKRGPKSTIFLEQLRKLEEAGYIEIKEKMYFATEEGMILSGVERMSDPADHAEALEFWIDKLNSKESAILRTIDDTGENGASKEDIAVTLDRGPKSTMFLQQLRDLEDFGLTEKRDGIYVAGSILFPERV